MKISSMKFMIIVNMMGNLLIISSQSWLIIWLGLEMMSLSMPPMMIMSNRSFMSKINAWKYFMIQCYSSAILFLSLVCLSNPSSWEMNLFQWASVMVAMFLKMGIIPFYGWMVQISYSIPWNIFLIMSTIQKIGPMISLSHMSEMIVYKSMSVDLFISCIVSVLSISGLLIKSIRMVIISSSMINSAWMIASIQVSKYSFLMFLASYMIHLALIMKMFFKDHSESVDSIHLFENKQFTYEAVKVLTIMSVIGMPPLMGFFAKLTVVSSLIETNQITSVVVLTLSSSIMMIMYLSLIISSISNMKFSINQFKSNTTLPVGMLIMVLGSTIMFFN